MSPAGRKLVVPKAVHDSVLAWIVQFTDMEVSAIVNPATRILECQRILLGSWPNYLFLVAAIAGIPWKESVALAAERAKDVTETIASVLKSQLAESISPDESARRLVSDLDKYQEFAEAMAIKISMAISKAPQLSTQPLLLGAAGLLLRSQPGVLMRRAVIAQELADKNWSSTHLRLCRALDANGQVPIPDAWGEKSWVDALTNSRAKVKKMLSDDISELRSFLSPHSELPPNIRKLRRKIQGASKI